MFFLSPFTLSQDPDIDLRSEPTAVLRFTSFACDLSSPVFRRLREACCDDRRFH
jgi:hypothetical protein